MRTLRFFSNCTAAAILLGLGSSAIAPATARGLEIAQQLSPAAVGAGVDASRVISPPRDFLERGRRSFGDEIRLLNQGGSVSAFSNDILIIDGSLEHENWLYPLEETETLLETDIRVIPLPE